jgi:hypothetical protein
MNVALTSGGGGVSCDKGDRAVSICIVSSWIQQLDTREPSGMLLLVVAMFLLA